LRSVRMKRSGEPLASASLFFSAQLGREWTIRFRAPERGKRTFVVTRRAAAPDLKLDGHGPIILARKQTLESVAFCAVAPTERTPFVDCWL